MNGTKLMNNGRKTRIYSFISSAVVPNLQAMDRYRSVCNLVPGLREKNAYTNF